MKQEFKNEKRNRWLLLLAIILFFTLASLCACGNKITIFALPHNPAPKTSAMALEPQPLRKLTALPPVKPTAPQSYINITENYIFSQVFNFPLKDRLFKSNLSNPRKYIINVMSKALRVNSRPCAGDIKSRRSHSAFPLLPPVCTETILCFAKTKNSFNA